MNQVINLRTLMRMALVMVVLFVAAPTFAQGPWTVEFDTAAMKVAENELQFDSGANFDAGIYRIEYISGAGDYHNSSGEYNLGKFFAMSNGVDSGLVVQAVYGTLVPSGPNTHGWSTVAEVETAARGTGQTAVVFKHAGGSPIGVRNNDTNYTDNSVPAANKITFRLVRVIETDKVDLIINSPETDKTKGTQAIPLDTKVPVFAVVPENLSHGTVSLSFTLPEGVVIYDEDKTTKLADKQSDLPITWDVSTDNLRSRVFYIEARTAFDDENMTLLVENPKVGGVAVTLDPYEDTEPVSAGICDCPLGISFGNNGCLHFELGLGSFSFGDDAGFLLIYADTPNASLSTPASLGAMLGDGLSGTLIEDGDKIVPSSSDFSDWGEAELNIIDDYEYEIIFRVDVSGTMTEYRKVRVHNPDESATVFNKLYIYETITLPGKSAKTQFWYFEYTAGTGSDGTWVLKEGHYDTGTSTATVLRITERAQAWNGSGDEVTETITIKEADGTTVVSKTEEVYKDFSWGREMLSRTRDPDAGTALKEVWTYYDNSGTDGDNYGRLESYKSEAGYWERYEYDADGNVSKTMRQHEDETLELGTAFATEAVDNIVEEYNEDDSVSVTFGGGAKTVRVEKWQIKVPGTSGVTVERTWYRIYIDEADSAIDGCTEEWSVRPVTKDPENGTTLAAVIEDALDGTDTTSIVTKTWYWEDGASGIGDNEPYDVRAMLGADGQVTVYERTIATNERTTVVKRGFSDSSVNDVVNGTGGADIEYGTKSTSVVDARGNMVTSKIEKISESDNAGDWFIVSLAKAASTDEFGRPTDTDYYFGEEAFKENDDETGTPAYDTLVSYGCCGGGEEETWTGRDGIQAITLEDVLGRTAYTKRYSNVPSAVVYSVNEYDAADRVTASGMSADDDLDDAADLKTVTAYDVAGRITSVTDPEGRKSYMTYRRVTTSGGAYTSGVFYWESRAYGNDADYPVSVTWADSHGNTVLSYTGSCASFTGAGGIPSGTETLTEHSRSTSVYDWANRMTEGRAYFNIASLAKNASGTAGTNYLVTGTIKYDALGRAYQRTDAAGNITETVYEDGTGRAIITQIGVDEDGDGDFESSEKHAVSRVFYKKFVSGNPTGDDRPWPTRVYTVKPNLASAPNDSDLLDSSPTLTDYVYNETVETHTVDATDDYLTASDRWSRPQYGPWSRQSADEQGRPVVSATTQNGDTTHLLTRSISAYWDTGDERDGKLRYTHQIEIDTSTNTATTKKIATNYSYDDAGRQVKAETTGRGYSKTAYDVFGRTERTVFASSEGTNTSVYGANAFTDDVVLTESVPTYDKSGLVTGTVTYSRAHDAPASTTGLLSAAAADQRRAAYSYTWYDDNGRQTHSGTSGTDSSYTYVAGTPKEPNSSDDWLISKVEYDDAGRAYLRTDNLGRKARVYFDDLGRTTHTVENYDAAKLTGSDPDTPASRDADVNRVTKTIYDNSATGGGARIETVAIDPDSNGNTSDNQSTLYIHSGEVNASERGPIRVNGRPIATLMPDAIEDGTDRADVVTEINAGGTVFGDFSFVEYYANGQVRRNTDARGVQVLTTYTNEGWLSLRQVYTATGSTWTPVGDLAMLWYYGDAGEVSNAFTYSDAAGNNQTSQIDYVYDGYYNVIEEKQDHDPGTSPSIKQTITYAFDKTLSTNTYSKAYRLDKITYPNGRVIQLNYDGHAGIDDAIGRANAIEEDSSGSDIVSYQYLGSGRMVRKSYPMTSGGVRLDMVDETGEGSDANDDYEVSLDKFGRPTRYQWEQYDSNGDAVSGGDLVHIAHAYDRNSNRLYDERKVATAYSKVFGRDALDRINKRDTGLIKFSGSTASIDSHWKLDSKTWNYDQLGNPATVDTAFDTSDRYGVTTNKANEITKLHNHATRGPDQFALDFEDTADEDIFTGQTNAANGSDLVAGTATVDTTNDWLVLDASGTGDTINGTNPALLLADVKFGALPFRTRFKVAALPTSGNALVGYAFGYTSDTDFYVFGRNMINGDYELYHMHDADSSGSIDFSDPDERKLVDSNFQAAANPLAGTFYNVTGLATFNSAMVDYIAASLDSEGGFPAGRVGLYTEVDQTSFDHFYIAPLSPAYALGANWETPSAHQLIDKGSGDGALHTAANFDQKAQPVFLRNVKSSRFEVVFKLTRRTGDVDAAVFFVFDHHGEGEESRLWIKHHPDADQTSENPIIGYLYENGDERSVPTPTSEVQGNNYAPTSESDEVWVQITSDGTTLSVKTADTKSNLSSATTSYATTNFPLGASTGPGRLGFASARWVAYIDDITVKTDTDGNGSFETTEIVETFDLDGSDHIEDTLEHDAAGNLTFDGSKRYTYDAHNRCVKVENAYRDSSDVVQVGSLLADWRYDARHRRIVEETYDADGAENTEHRYCIGGSLVETRNGSNQVTQQHVWDNLTGGYIDSLAQVSNNADPGVDDDPGTSGVQDLCEDHYYVLQDVQFNVLAIVDDTGEVVERYEYTLYGQRTVMNGQSAPLSSTAYAMTIGFQGLRHDLATGSIDNRARLYLPTLHRFAQRDPLGYPDGMNSYAAYHVLRQTLDPWGKDSWFTATVNFIGGGISKTADTAGKRIRATGEKAGEIISEVKDGTVKVAGEMKDAAVNTGQAINRGAGAAIDKAYEFLGSDEVQGLAQEVDEAWKLWRETPDNIVAITSNSGNHANSRGEIAKAFSDACTDASSNLEIARERFMFGIMNPTAPVVVLFPMQEKTRPSVVGTSYYPRELSISLSQLSMTSASFVVSPSGSPRRGYSTQYRVSGLGTTVSSSGINRLSRYSPQQVAYLRSRLRKRGIDFMDEALGPQYTDEYLATKGPRIAGWFSPSECGKGTIYLRSDVKDVITVFDEEALHSTQFLLNPGAFFKAMETSKGINLLDLEIRRFMLDTARTRGLTDSDIAELLNLHNEAAVGAGKELR